ncbi:daptomycin-sensing surface protein LiaX [Lacticaseibacillus hulanensis]|uniref:daptomycin-sensing surface protein LiaX n=1 Tax=Lacticaseibacillus hulanensis TaxID=2493111 RepID=UPI0013E2FF20|nr:daptomycin-sensing surface protein LiaX [Lacticaseibacillus hulanensis]
MNERERILDLVKKGILSSEEGLVLLENLATQGKETAPTEPEAPKPDDVKQDEAKPEAKTDAKLDELEKKRAAAKTKLDTTTDELASLRRQIAANDEQIIVYDTMEDLDTLTPEKAEARLTLKGQNQELTAKATALEEARVAAKQELSDLERDLRKQQVHSSLDKVLPDDWQAQAKSAAADLGKTVTDATSQIGSIVKKTAKTVIDNVDWKDVTVRVPGIVTQRFTHTFTYEHNQATVLDVNVANGDIHFTQWDKDDIQVIANVRLFGKVAGEPFDAFTERSRIEVSDDSFIFQVPNKRVEANLTISLPRREYDHLAARTLNGNITFEDIKGKDFYVKTTNGDLRFRNTHAVMLEAENVNGSVKATDSVLKSAVLSTVNGDARFAGSANSLKLTTVNGDAKLTVTEPIEAVTATSVNGDVKLALPLEQGMSGHAKTRFGSIRSRMQDVQAPSKLMHTLDFNRPGATLATVNISTVTGDILLKDTDITK